MQKTARQIQTEEDRANLALVPLMSYEERNELADRVEFSGKSMATILAEMTPKL